MSHKERGPQITSRSVLAMPAASPTGSGGSLESVTFRSGKQTSASSAHVAGPHCSCLLQWPPLHVTSQVCAPRYRRERADALSPIGADHSSDCRAGQGQEHAAPSPIHPYDTCRLRHSALRTPCVLIFYLCRRRCRATGSPRLRRLHRIFIELIKQLDLLNLELRQSEMA